MPQDENKSTIGERLTGVRDSKDPDGLLTVEQAENPPDPRRVGIPHPDGADPTKRDPEKDA